MLPLVLSDSFFFLIFNNNLNTPLHIAVKCQHAKIAKDLINSGANIAIQNKEGKTALDIAVKNQSIEIIGILVANGANINTQDMFFVGALIKNLLFCKL